MGRPLRCEHGRPHRAAQRRARRMTQAVLAREAHVSFSMIKACERGVRVPSPPTLEAIAGYEFAQPDHTRHRNSRHPAPPVGAAPSGLWQGRMAWTAFSADSFVKTLRTG
ncbi:helix-turn-helix domain-containing protein [Streptomyces sp. NPDC059564]|uniref:helix-turn-helix domain-containing protein n=1 Tax=Streptomyces sp. NPDC059564 TaxID=3346865 RepID=UPI0036BD22CE